MLERPILFSAPMVRAILDGQKTQTRRVVKPQPPKFVRHSVAPQELRGEPKKHTAPYFDAYNGGPHWCWWDEYDRQGAGWIKCPYGKPGDRLWVRETVACGACAPGKPSHWSPAFWRREQGTPSNPNGLWYAADDLAPERPITARGKWTPAIHMPRWASRILLEIVSIRVERLNACSEADALAEGSQHPSLVPIVGAGWSSRDMYARLWEHINGEGSWSANPWVWVVEFKRAQP